MSRSSVQNVLGLPAVEQAQLVRSGELSARELVQASLDAIDQLNPSINAFTHIAPERSLAEADEVRPGDRRPFCGVPVGIKDFLSATRGLPTSEGSDAWGDWVADHDSAHVRRLREAGAIIVGRTNTPELGLRPVTENDRFGVTRNPHNPALSPGGSSGGSAAAVAAAMVGLADGSDLGGSLRIPASCCGVVGLKPSRGRVSIGPDYGDIGSGTPVDGVLTRTVLDTAVALDAVSGYEPGDHRYLPPPAVPFADVVTREPGPLRIHVALDAPLGVPVDDEPRAAALLAADALADARHEVREQAPAWDDESFPPSWSMFTTGALQHLVRVVERLHGQPLSVAALEPATRAWAVDSTPVALVDYLEAAERLWAFARRLLRGWPADTVLVTPTLTRLPAEVGVLRANPGVTDDGLRFSAFVRIWNVTGQPALSLPFHETSDGTPVGVQLVGPPGRDDLVLALAAQLEAMA
jgi:amidase